MCALDIKALPEDYPRVTGVPGSGDKAWRSLEVLATAGAPLEVRTTPMPGPDDLAYLGALMKRLTVAGVDGYALQQCRQVDVPEQSLALPARLADANEAIVVARSVFPHFSLRVG